VCVVCVLCVVCVVCVVCVSCDYMHYKQSYASYASYVSCVSVRCLYDVHTRVVCAMCCMYTILAAHPGNTKYHVWTACFRPGQTDRAAEVLHPSSPNKLLFLLGAWPNRLCNRGTPPVLSHCNPAIALLLEAWPTRSCSRETPTASFNVVLQFLYSLKHGKPDHAAEGLHLSSLSAILLLL
jgi:hypothetical protein